MTVRITFVLAAFDLSGGGRVVAIYAEAMRRRGHDVFVVACPPPSPTLRERFRAIRRGEKIQKEKCDPSHFDATDIPRKLTDRRRPIVDADVPDADVVIATWWETAHWVHNLSSSKGAKIHFIQHYEDFFPEFASDVEAAWRLPMPKITIARWLTRLAEQRFGTMNVTEISNSVDIGQFYAAPRRRNSTPTVGMLYSTIPWKGVRVGVTAFERLRLRFPDARLVTFGATNPANDLPLPPNSFHVRQPPQDEVRDVYAQCDVWLCPSQVEGFGLTALEAMACRCPVVATRSGGPEDIVEDGVNGFLCPVDDDIALANRMIDVLDQPEADWQRMSDAALAKATGYSWEDAADRFERALINTVEHNTNRRR